MPTIRITEEHYDKLEQLAVDKTAEKRKIVTIGEALGDLLNDHFEGEKCGKKSKPKKTKEH